MIKKSFRLMLLVAFALSSVMFVACNKYDDDIDRIDQEIASLQATVQSLQSAISGGAVVTGVNNGTDGITFTMSNGQSYTVKHGTNGKDGQNGTNGTNGADGKTPVITIDPETNNWVIDGVDTGVCAKGAKGDKGDTGAQGPAGTNGTNGTNGTDGKDGQNGKDGLNGYSPKISEGILLSMNRETRPMVPAIIRSTLKSNSPITLPRGSMPVTIKITPDASAM